MKIIHKQYLTVPILNQEMLVYNETLIECCFSSWNIFGTKFSSVEYMYKRNVLVNIMEGYTCFACFKLIHSTYLARYMYIEVISHDVTIAARHRSSTGQAVEHYCPMPYIFNKRFRSLDKKCLPFCRINSPILK